jgi:hypothetical protein
MTANSDLGSIVSRLQGLKNVSGRRVMPGDHLLNDLEEPQFNINEPAPKPPMPNFSNFLMPNQANLGPNGGVPPADMANSTPQGSDVRANVAVDEPQKENPGFWENIYNGLSSGLSTLGKHSQERQPEPQPMPEVQNDTLPPDSGTPPTQEVVTENMEPQVNAAPELNQQEPAPAQKEPFTSTSQEEVDQALSNPETKAEIERLFQVPLTNEMHAQLDSMSKVLSTFDKDRISRQTKLTAYEEKLRQRIEAREMTGKEQLLMAIALAAPAVLAGLTMGKEAGFGVLGGVAGGARDVLLKDYKDNIADEEKLNEIGAEKLKVQKESIDEQQKFQKMKAELEKQIPNRDLRDFAKANGRLMPDGKIILPTGNDDFPVVSTKIQTMKDLTNFKKDVLPKLEAAKSLRDQISDIGQVMSELLVGAEKKRDNISFSTVEKIISDKFPNMRAEFMGPDGKPLKYDVVYSGLRERYGELRRQLYDEKGTGESQQKRFDKEFPNPFEGNVFSGKISYPQAKVQLKLQMQEINKKIINEAKAKGVYTDLLEKELSNDKFGKDVKDEERKQKRVNDAVAQSKGK